MADEKEEVRIDYERVSVLIHVIEKARHYGNYMDIVRSAERELSNIDADCKEQLREIVGREQDDLARKARDHQDKLRQIAQDSADAGYQPTAPVALPNPALAPVPAQQPTPIVQEPTTSAPAPSHPAPAVPGANETGFAGTSGGVAEPDLPPAGSSVPQSPVTDPATASGTPEQPTEGTPAEPAPITPPSEPIVPPVTTAETAAPTPNAAETPPDPAPTPGQPPADTPAAVTRRSV